MIISQRRCFLISLGLAWFLSTAQTVAAKFTTHPRDFEAVVGENVTFTWEYDLRWLENRRGMISFGIVNPNRTEYEAVLVKTIEYSQRGEVMVEIFKNPASNGYEFSSLRDRSSSERNTRAQFMISNLSEYDSKAYFCQLNVGVTDLAVITDHVSLKVVDLAIDKEQSSKEVTSWVDHRVSLVCSVRAAPDASPAFSWHRKRDPTSVINAKQNDEWARSVLTILTIKADDFDSYVCTARTTQSTVTLEIPIKRLVKPGKITKFNVKQFANKTGKFVRLTWEPPLNDGGAPVLHYVVKYKQQSSPPRGWSMAKRLETILPYMVLKQTEPKVEMYDVRVRAKTKVGHGNELEYVLNFAVPVVARFTSKPADLSLFVGEDALFEWKFYVDPPGGVQRVTFGVVHDGQHHGIVVKKIKMGKTPMESIMHNGNPRYPASWFKPRMMAVDNSQASFELFDVKVNDTGSFYCQLYLGRLRGSLSDKVHLKVDDVKINKAKSTKVVESWVGNEIRMTCAATVASGTTPTFSWTRGADNLTISKGNHVDTLTESFLSAVTSDARDFNTSGFVCTVHTPSTTVRHVVRVKRLYEPMAPSGLQAFKESHPERGSIVKLSWTPPKDDGKTPITSYVIEYRSPGDQWRGTVLKETTRPEYEISAAGDGSQRFHVRVQAKNKVGKGPPSQYITLSFDPTPKVRARSNGSQSHRFCLGTLLEAWALLLASCCVLYG